MHGGWRLTTIQTGNCVSYSIYSTSLQPKIGVLLLVALIKLPLFQKSCLLASCYTPSVKILTDVVMLEHFNNKTQAKIFFIVFLLFMYDIMRTVRVNLYIRMN